MADRTIKSPYPGTFYRRSDPNAEPYASEGDTIGQGDVVGLVEIMKNFFEVTSDQTGVVERFLVENEGLVEAGQDLVIVADTPSGS
jgi:acetyl-CoA carboxylase biotin carboxyl carrier protein